MSDLWRQLRRRGDRTLVELGSASERAIETSFRILLLRAPDATERRDRSRALKGGQSQDELNRAFLARPSFARRTTDSPAAAISAAIPTWSHGKYLRASAKRATFVAAAYRCLLGRDADAAGRAYYLERLSHGASHLSVIKALALSDEFDARYKEICP